MHHLTDWSSPIVLFLAAEQLSFVTDHVHLLSSISAAPLVIIGVDYLHYSHLLQATIVRQTTWLQRTHIAETRVYHWLQHAPRLFRSPPKQLIFNTWQTTL